MSTLSRLIAGALALGAAASASATQYVTNGDFSQTTATSSRQMSDDNNKGAAQYVAGWTNMTANTAGTAGYNFLMMGATAATTAGGVQTDDNGTLSLWAATDSNTIAGGSGGNFLAADGAYEQSEIYQTLTGLTVGKQYDVSFNWAGAQQSGYSGTTTDNWTVYWGADLTHYVSQQTATVTDQSHGFTGWMAQTFTFTATGTSQVLGFMATGTPNGQPPFALLDDVSVTDHIAAAVPEPASWAMMIAGFGLVGASLRKRRGATAFAA